jgi:anti-anti-sigma factor
VPASIGMARRAIARSSPALRGSPTHRLGHPDQMREDAKAGSAGHFTLKSQVRDSSLELVAVGELDMAAAFNFESRVDALLGAGRVRDVVLDLAQVEFVDSAGLGALLSNRDRAHQLGVALEIPRVSTPVGRALELMGVRDFAAD